MPFGLKNCPVIFLAMMHDLQEERKESCEQKGITLDQDNGSMIIMDDMLLYSSSQEKVLQICRCCCEVAHRINLTWKLKKCRWAP
eukprot:2433614-Ditylum_brightwellii.AAC.1